MVPVLPSLPGFLSVSEVLQIEDTWDELCLLNNDEMNQEPTRETLLFRIRDLNDDAAWKEFADAYTPLIYGYACRVGLQDDDAITVSQDVLSTVARNIGDFRYDPSKGRFRSWLKAIVRSRITDFVRSQQRQERGSGDTRVHLAIQAVERSNNDDAIWQLEYRRSAFHWAAERTRIEFRSKTWEAFWKTSVEGLSVKETAESLKMTVGAVYIARSRILTRLREVVTEYHEAREHPV